MSKSKAAKPKAKEDVDPKKKERDSKAARRESVESIVVAVILAFLFRAFVAEAFVIPTGSMASTLQGRHMDVVCPECGYQYQTGASAENEGEGEVVATRCPICRFRMTLNKQENSNHRSFNGDRILVSKFAYEIGDPARWDVIVFKYPGNAKQNYIKRLVGLPDELIMIREGDVYTSPMVASIDLETSTHVGEGLLAGKVHGDLRRLLADQGIELSDQIRIEHESPDESYRERRRLEWTVEDAKSGESLFITTVEDTLRIFRNEQKIARKPPHKQLAMMQLVDDSNYIATEFLKSGWPSRWQDWSSGTSQKAWTVSEDGHTFSSTSDGWLRYRHIIPFEGEWEGIFRGRLPDRPLTGQLITDYYPYNDGSQVTGRRYLMASHADVEGLHWVGDLAAEFDVELADEPANGKLLLDLVEGGVHYQCTIDIGDGTATLSINDGAETFSNDQGETANAPTAKVDVAAGGTHSFRYSNIDNQIRLWVDGRLAEFDGPTTFTPSFPVLPRWSQDDPGDLEPIGIGCEGARLTVNRAKVFRDLYYVAQSAAQPSRVDYEGYWPVDRIEEIMRTPSMWNDPMFESRRYVWFITGEEQYFPLGDNSPQSKDARLWWEGTEANRHYPELPPPYVKRELLTGKALLIYWPHSWRPFFPNFARMGLIR